MEATPRDGRVHLRILKIPIGLGSLERRHPPKYPYLLYKLIKKTLIIYQFLNILASFSEFTFDKAFENRDISMDIWLHL